MFLIDTIAAKAAKASIMAVVFITLTYTNTSVRTTANVPLTIDGINTNTTIEIITNKSVVGSINITKCAFNLSGTSELKAKIPLSYLRIMLSDEIIQSMVKGKIKAYYLDEEIKRNDLDESTLKAYWWNGIDWELANSGVNLKENYVWIVAKHLSDYAIGGDPIKFSPPAPASATVYPIIITEKRIQRLIGTAETVKGLIRQLRYMGKPFFTAQIELAGVLGALGYFLVPQDMVKAINDVVMKPVQNIRKDVYAFAGEYSVKKFGKSEKVIIARGDLGVDSIASVTYAMTLNVPILLVEPCAIPKPTAKALKKLETRSVTIVGGPVAVSEEVAKKLPNASRMFGQNRHETAVKIAEALMAQIEVDTVVITDGIDPDPISIILASKYHAPIIYTEGDNVPPVTQEFLRNKFRIIMVGVTDAAALKIKSIAGFK
jgi:hypothetical protein